MKKGKRIQSIALAGVLALSMVLGAGGPELSAKAKKATLKTKKISVKVGKSKTIVIKNKKKTCKYTFKSSKKKVASVSAKGKVKGVKAGSAKITVKEVAKKGKGKARTLGTVKVTVTKVAKPDKTKAPDKTATPDQTKTPGGTDMAGSVNVYVDEISDANKVASVGAGLGLDPTPTPDANAEPTPEPTPKMIYDVSLEDDDMGPIVKRGDAKLNIVNDGADGSGKCVEVSNRSQDWHGAEVDVAKVVETDQKYEISFYAKQSTGADSKIDLSCQYIPNAEGSTKYDGIKSFDLPNDEWVKCETVFTVPEHVGAISIYWQSVYNSNNFMDFRLDSFQMKGVEKAQVDSGMPDLSAGLVKGKVGNPIMTSRLTADPWAMEYNGRVYVYGTNDSQQYGIAPEADNNYAKINTLNCYSSADMVNWTDHGVIQVAGSKGAAKWAGNSWAPAAAHKKINGKEKFFLYFANSANSIGVLTADSPTGPWTDPIGKAFIDRSTPGCSEKEIPWLFDPAVLVDDDGSAYLYFGGIGDTKGKSEEFLRNPKCMHVVKLGGDMISLDGEPKMIDAPFPFEDSGINKINGKYYFSYCTNWATGIDRKVNGVDCPTANIAVMVSDKPMEGFKYVGCVMKNPGNYFGATGNNHHCFTSVKGTMYAFYHTKKDTVALGTKQDYRTSYVNLLNLGDNGNFTNKDGSVADTKMTVTGVEAVNVLDPYQTVEAETFALADTVGTVANEEKNSVSDWNTNYSIFNNKIGAYIGVTEVDFGKDGAGKVTLKLGDTTKAGYKEYTVDLSKKLTGKHTVYFTFDKLGVLMDSWKFSK